MDIDIPIIITRGTKNTHEQHFKQAPPLLLRQLKENRSPTVPKPRNTNLQVRHQTLDHDQPVAASRTKRISSSAAAKRFPKDFFKDENCLHPIKSIRTKHKQCEPCLLDTFSHKNFLIGDSQPQSKPQEESDTPKFKHKAEGQPTKKISEGLRSKVEQLLHETPISKYHTASQNENKHPLLQIFEPQRQEMPFGPVPFISNFNVTLGQKVAMSFLMQKGQRKKKKNDEKENNEGMRPDSARRESCSKAEGFRIRRKLLQ